MWCVMATELGPVAGVEVFVHWGLYQWSCCHCGGLEVLDVLEELVDDHREVLGSHCGELQVEVLGSHVEELQFASCHFEELSWYFFASLSGFGSARRTAGGQGGGALACL